MRLLMSLVLLILISGCESILNVELERSTPQIVVTCVFTENTPWQLLLQRTVGPQDDPVLPSVIENANVIINGSDGSYIELTHKGGGFYFGNKSLPQSGITYSLRVEAQGYTTVEATDQIPSELRVQSVRQLDNQGAIVITINDQGDIRNYYAISLYLPTQIIQETFKVLNIELGSQIRQLFIEDPFLPTIDEPYVHIALIHDKPFDGKQYDVTLSTLSMLSREERSVYVRSVSQAYYDYYMSKIVQINSEDLAFAEPAPINSNIHGGQGIFAGYRLHVEGDLTPQNLKQQLVGDYYLRDIQTFPNEPNTMQPDIKFSLYQDHTVTGYVRYSLENNSTAEVSLNGGYTITDLGIGYYLVQLHHSSNTLFRNTDLEIRRHPRGAELILVANQQEEKGRGFRTVTRTFVRQNENNQ